MNSKESDDKSNKVGPETVEDGDGDKLFQSRSDLEKDKSKKYKIFIITPKVYFPLF